jgi:hypothetical protein
MDTEEVRGAAATTTGTAAIVAGTAAEDVMIGAGLARAPKYADPA